MKSPTFVHFWKVCFLALWCISCQKEIKWSYYVSSYAGGPEFGPWEGSVDSVYFAGPNNLAIDRSGIIYVSDRNTHKVRKILPGGTVVLLAGNHQGFVDGVGASARFNVTRGLTLDAEGNLYVADRYNNSIRMVAPDGAVTTVAGGGRAGFSNGTGKAIRFNNPIGLVMDNYGNVYITDSYNNRIRKLAPDGSISTVAGRKRGFADGDGVAASFNDPDEIAIDEAGNIYVADRGNHSIRKVTPEGHVTTVAGNGAPGYMDGSGEQVQFNSPLGVAVDKRGNIYVSDSENNCIRKIDPDGSVVTIAGNGTAGYADGAGFLARFNRPRGLALDPRGDYLFVADRDNLRIRKIDLR